MRKHLTYCVELPAHATRRLAATESGVRGPLEAVCSNWQDRLSRHAHTVFICHHQNVLNFDV